MTEHLKEIEEVSRLKIGIIMLIKELDKYRNLKQIQDYLKDLVEGVYIEDTKKERKKALEDLLKEGK